MKNFIVIFGQVGQVNVVWLVFSRQLSNSNVSYNYIERKQTCPSIAQ